MHGAQPMDLWIFHMLEIMALSKRVGKPRTLWKWINGTRSPSSRAVIHVGPASRCVIDHAVSLSRNGSIPIRHRSSRWNQVTYTENGDSSRVTLALGAGQIFRFSVALIPPITSWFLVIPIPVTKPRIDFLRRRETTKTKYPAEQGVLRSSLVPNSFNSSHWRHSFHSSAEIRAPLYCFPHGFFPFRASALVLVRGRSNDLWPVDRNLALE